MATERHDVTKVLGRLADLEAGFETVDPVELTSEERARGHVRARSSTGRELFISLPRGDELAEGDVLAIAEGVALVVAAAAEDLFEITPKGDHEWGIAAYHLGNLHRPVRLEGGTILTPYEPACEELITAASIACRRVSRGFSGERLGSFTGGHADGNAHGHV